MSLFSGGLNLDEDDEMLVHTMANLYRLSQNKQNKNWLDVYMRNAYDLVSILSKNTDKEWIMGGEQNVYCIYYALYVIFELAEVSHEYTKKLLSVPNITTHLYELLSGSMTWWEQRGSIRTILSLINNCKSDDEIKVFIHSKLVALCADIYVNCLETVIKQQVIVPSKKEGYVTDLLLKAKGCLHDSMYAKTAFISSQIIDCAKESLSSARSILALLAKSDNTDIIALFDAINTTNQWEKLCEMDFCWPLLSTVPNPNSRFPLAINIGTTLQSLTIHERFAKKVSESDVLIDAFILKLESALDIDMNWYLCLLEIIKHLIGFNLINEKKYFTKLCDALLYRLESSRDGCHSTVFGSLFPFELAIKCLASLFCVKLPTFAKKKRKSAVIFQEKMKLSVLNKINGSEWKVYDMIGTHCECWKFIKNKFQKTKFNGDLKEKFIYFCDFMIKETKVRTKQNEKEWIINARNARLEGNNHFKCKNYKKAIEFYLKSLQICPNNCDDRVTYYSNIALSYLKMNDYKNAEKYAKFGLVAKCIHIKLCHVLLECYKIKSNCHYRFYIKRIHNTVMFDFVREYNNFYSRAKLQIKDACDHDPKELQVMLYKLRDTDPYFCDLCRLCTEYGQLCSIVSILFMVLKSEYEVFKVNRKVAKKDIYKLIIDIVRNVDNYWEFQDGADRRPTLGDICDVVQVKYYSMPDQSEQELMVSAYMNDSENECKIEIATEISEIILKYYCIDRRLYNFDKGVLIHMIAESRHLSFGKTIRENEWGRRGEHVYYKSLWDFENESETVWESDDSALDSFRGCSTLRYA